MQDRVREGAGGPRMRPSLQQWDDSRSAFIEVIDDLKPERLLVLGLELNARRPPVSDDVSVVAIAHPSSNGFSYEAWLPTIAAAWSAPPGLRQDPRGS
jgi:hypothetical protein